MYSQLGQELIVLELLQGMHGGFFLDSGAADGVSGSNTLVLETRFGWRGICVEPNTHLYSALVRNRRCVCVNCCLYSEEGEVDFLEDARLLGGILAEYHPALLQHARSRCHIALNEAGQLRTVRKTTRTIRSVLRQARAPRIIDYWSLDTEGSELTLLRSFPFDEYAFRVLTVEHNRFPVKTQIRSFLESRGYEFVKDLGIDDCYRHATLMPSMHWRSSAWPRTRRS